jgi:hypothetical protein
MPRVFPERNGCFFLRLNSKLYLLLKKTFFDRSKRYALHDIEFYKKRRSDIDEQLNAIVGIKLDPDKANIDLLVVILRYEYQLRMGGLKEPQILLNSFFAKHKIEVLGLYEYFTQLNSEDYFLYGDPMHLSSVGHEVVTKRVAAVLK